MTTENTGSESQTSKTESNDVEKKSSNQETISYDKYRELLDEKKKLAAQHSETKATLEKMLAEKEEVEKKTLEEKQEFKKLYEAEQLQKKKALALLEAKEKAEIENKKYEAFAEKIGGLKKSEYKKFIDFDAIPLVDGKIDDSSLESYVSSFRTSFPELIKENTKTLPPNTAPQSKTSPTNFGNLSAEDLLKKYKEDRLAKR